MNTPTVPKPEQRRLKAHFGLAGLPFRKNVAAHQMFDSQSQRELLAGLRFWLEVQGLALVTGPSGAGKSITLRRFVRELPRDRYAVFRIGQIPTTPSGFMRSLCRQLGLKARLHRTDMFDDAQRCLGSWTDQHGTHPILVFDDAEGMTAPTLDLLRRLTAAELDAETRFSVLLASTESLLNTLRESLLEPLANRFTYVAALRPFSIEDTRNYVRFHLEHAGARDDIFSDPAIATLFHASKGVPRAINQVALQALIHAAVHGVENVDADRMKRVLHAHPLYRLGGKR